MKILNIDKDKDAIKALQISGSFIEDTVVIKRINDACIDVYDANGWWSAGVKWDGCIDFYSYANISYWDDPERKDKDCCDNYIHLCEGGNDMIETIKILQEIGKREFKESHTFWQEKKE